MNRILNFFKKFFFSDKFTLYVRITLILAIVGSIFQENWFNVFISLLTYILTYAHLAPARYNIVLPHEFQFFIVFFVFCSLFLWEIHWFYGRFAWWDTFLHGFSSIALWFTWFLIMYIFWKTKKFQAPIILIAIFSFCFALALWAIWEIFEYSVDEFLWTNMQKARWLELIYWTFDTRHWVQDTMHDLIIDSIWAFLASISWYFYLKKWESIKWFDSLVTAFERTNKRLFE